MSQVMRYGFETFNIFYSQDEGCWVLASRGKDKPEKKLFPGHPGGVGVMVVDRFSGLYQAVDEVFKSFPVDPDERLNLEDLSIRNRNITSLTLILSYSLALWGHAYGAVEDKYRSKLGFYIALNRLAQKIVWKESLEGRKRVLLGNKLCFVDPALPVVWDREVVVNYNTTSVDGAQELRGLLFLPYTLKDKDGKKVTAYSVSQLVDIRQKVKQLEEKYFPLFAINTERWESLRAFKQVRDSLNMIINKAESKGNLGQLNKIFKGGK